LPLETRTQNHTGFWRLSRRPGWARALARDYSGFFPPRFSEGKSGFAEEAGSVSMGKAGRSLAFASKSRSAIRGQHQEAHPARRVQRVGALRTEPGDLHVRRRPIRPPDLSRRQAGRGLPRPSAEGEGQHPAMGGPEAPLSGVVGRRAQGGTCAAPRSGTASFLPSRRVAGMGSTIASVAAAADGLGAALWQIKAHWIETIDRKLGCSPSFRMMRLDCDAKLELSRDRLVFGRRTVPAAVLRLDLCGGRALYVAR
jgi:hypothetical protein